MINQEVSTNQDNTRNTTDSDEPLMNNDNFRFTIKPIDNKYKILWKLYKKQQESYWTA